MSESKLYTVDEARQLLKYKSKKSIYRLIDAGKLKVKKLELKHYSRYFIEEDSLKEYMDAVLK